MSSDLTDAERKETGQRAQARGTSQSGARLYNERLVLSLIRKHASLPKAEIARLTALSAQTVSVIVRQLESDGLLLKQEPQRGKVGQPLVPFTLNPEGAFSIGLKVGRRSADLMLMDLAGQVRKVLRQPYRFPTPSDLLGFVQRGLAELTSELSRKQRERIAGLGIAAPFELWNWEEEIGAPHAVLEAWRGFDLAQEIGKLCSWPVQFCNDATAACAAELLFGHGAAHRDYAYFYIGYFAGGGIVLNGTLFQGRSGNAGALGSLPVPGKRGARQLIQIASFNVLEQALQAVGRDPDFLWQTPTDWSAAAPQLDDWIDDAAAALAIAATGVAAVIECSAAIIDGAMPDRVRTALCQAVREHLKRINTQGISPFEIAEGSIGVNARAMGAASLPLFANFIIDRDVLFKENA